MSMVNRGKSMKVWAIVTLCLFTSNIIHAAKIKVYRWVDENGVVTFSEYRPAKTDYEEIEVEGDRIVGTDQKLNYDLNSKDSNKVKGEVVEELNAQAEKYCEKAKHNLKVLDAFNKVRVLDENGEPVVLSKEQVLEQRRLANRQVEMFCQRE